MKKFINKLLPISVLSVLGIVVIYILSVYLSRYVFTPAEGTKQIVLDNGSEILSVNVDYRLSGKGGHVTIEELQNTNDGIVNAAGGIGSPVNITAKRRSVENATITFNYDKDKFQGENAYKLGIAYYNEEAGRMELLDSSLDAESGSISVETTHFSEYVVVDTDEWYDAWLASQLRIRDASDTNYFNISFVLDNSGSMEGEKNKLSREAAYDFITELYDNDTFSLITFNSTAQVVLPSQQYGESDKGSLKSITDSISAGGGTSIDNALECGINELSANTDTSKQRLLILLSDGQSSVDEDYFVEAEAKQIKIITIGFGNDADEKLLQKIASENGGKYYKASEKKVKEIFELIREEYLGVDLSIDSDGDKLPDKVETVGMRTQYGYMIRTDAYSADTDGDGMTDGEEMGTFVVDENVSDRDRARGLTAYAYFRMNSNPLIPDGNTKDNGDEGAYKDGEFSISFNTGFADTDISYDFYYSDDFFKQNSAEYNNKLSIASLGMAMSAFSTKESEKYWTDDNVYIASGKTVRREDNIIKAYSTLGFIDARFYNYDVTLNDSSDKVAYSFAHKTIRDGNDEFTLITVITRGGSYGAEWASNFNVGSGGLFHDGFNDASWEVYRSLWQYMDDLNHLGKLNDKVKFWFTGFSRGAAVANLTAGKLCMMNSISSSDVFAYLFATPQGINGKKYPDYKDVDTSGIFNIINPGDVVPAVALSEWGFARFGTDRHIGAADDDKDDQYTDTTVGDTTVDSMGIAKSNFNKITGGKGSPALVETVLNTKSVETAAGYLYNLAKTPADFESKYQDLIVDFLALSNMRLKDDPDSSLIDRYKLLYGDEEEVFLKKALGHIVIMSFTKYSEDAVVLCAMAEQRNVNISGAFLKLILSFIGDAVEIGDDALVGVDVFDLDVQAHNPEVYLAWLLYHDEYGGLQ